MTLKNIFIILGVFLLTACFGHLPFQPAPPKYKYWVKSGVSEKGIKQKMIECGYPSIYGFDKSNYIPNEVAAAEQCMFRNGFENQNGYQGICSLKDYKNMPACQGRECSDKNEFGCSPSPSFNKN